MRALVDAHHLGQGQTGNETWARNVVAGLVDGTDEVHVAVTAAGRAQLPTTIDPDRAHLVSAASARRLVVDLPRVLRTVGPDALLVQYTLPPRCRVPAVVVVHDLSFERPEARAWIPRASLLRYRATIRASARQARRILVPSEFTRADLVDRYGIAADRVIVAGNAVDPDLEAALAATPRASDANRRVVLAVGTVQPRKNLEIVAGAVAELRRQHLPAVLRLVGPVPTAGRAMLGRMAAVLGPALEVCGVLDTAALASAYRSADVLAFPSLFEGFGIPLVEAMAARTPVLSSDATALPEIGADAVLYAAPDSPDQWLDQLRLVLTDQGTADRLSVAGTARAQTFSWSRSAAAARLALAQAAA